MAHQPANTPQTSRTVPLIHLLNQVRAALVTFEHDVLTLRSKSGKTTKTVRATDIADVQLQGQAVINRLNVQTKQGRSIAVSGLDRITSQALHAQLHARVEELLDDEAASSAHTLWPDIQRLAMQVNALLNTDRYIRHSASMELKDAVHSLARK